MNIIDYAKLYSARAHEGQKRKFTGEPYYLHPYRVATKLLKLNDNYNGSEGQVEFQDHHIAAAFLHDVVEDCGYPIEAIRSDFNWLVGDAVWALTNTSKQDHPEANRAERKRIDRLRLADASAPVQSIKAADRIDNLYDIRYADPAFFSLYLHESKLLLDVLTKADIRLRQELAETIESGVE